MIGSKARVTRRCKPLAVALGLVAGLAGAPYAGAGISNTVFSIEATNTSGNGAFSVAFAEGEWNPTTKTYTWSLPSPVDLLDGGSGALVATLEDASLLIHAGGLSPQIDLRFDVIAVGGDTDFFVDSALVDFPTIPASTAAGRFAVSAGVVDLTQPSDGVWMIGRGPQMGIYQSWYNGAAPDGSVFSELLGVVGIGPGGGSASGSERYPSSGHAAINEDVSDMSIHAAFLLTADDYASGTAVFGLVPEPTALVLLVLGAVLTGGRRRG